MLFASIGWMKADNELTLSIPADAATTKGKVTVTVSGGSNGKLTYGSKEQTGSTATLTIPQTEAEQSDLAISIEGYTTITINGKVTKCVLNYTKATSLTFTNNGELTWLNLNGATALETLSCPNNKLQAVPKKGKIKNYTVGTQSPTGLSWDNVDNKPANTPISLTPDKLKNSQSNTYFDGITDPLNYYSYALTLVDPDNKAADATPQKDANNNYTYTFYNASGKVYASYGDGDGIYKATLTFTNSHPDYPGVVLKDIPVKVKTAAFDIELETPENGTVSIQAGKETINTGKKIAKNTELQITFAGATGYEFDKEAFLKNGYKGLKDLSWVNNLLTCKVKGDVNPEINATFKGKNLTVSYTPELEGGKVSVALVGGAVIPNGGTFPYGSKLQITPEPKEGFKVESVYVGEDEVKVDTKTGEYVTTSGLTKNASIVVTFVPKADNTKNVTFVGTSVTWTAKSGLTKESDGTYKATPGKEVVFSVSATGKTIRRVLMNGTALSSEGTGFYRFIMPETDVNITAEMAELTTMTIKAESQKVTYDGTAKAFTNYTITVDSKELPITSVDKVKIEYKVDKASDETYITDQPKLCGTYNVRISRPEDNIYSAVSAVTNVTLTIDPATPKVTLPTEVKVVETKKDGKTTYKYQATGGSFGNGLTGVIEFVKTKADKSENDVLYKADDATQADAVKSATESHLVMIRFNVYNSSTDKQHNPNYAFVYAEVPAKVGSAAMETFTVTLKQPAAGTLKMYNGDTELSSGAKVAKGTVLTFKTTGVNNMSSYQIAPLNGDGSINQTLVGQMTIGNTKVTLEDCKEADASQELPVISDMTVGINGTAATLKTVELKKDRDAVEEVYNGKPHLYDLSGKLVESGKTTALTGDYLDKITVTYKQGNSVVAAPVEAGEYTVVLTAPNYLPSTGDCYAAINLVDKLVINKAEPTFEKNISLTATPISIGQKLGQSKIVGAAPIEGNFEFVEKDKVMDKASGDDGFECAVKFIPKDQKNYKEVTLDTKVSVIVDSSLRITYAPVNGTITVKDKTGKEYPTGSVITEGTQLTVTATPAAGYDFVNMTIGSNTTTNTTQTVTVGKASIAITATFAQRVNKAIITFAPQNGTITVKDNFGNTYASGSAVAEGTQLTVTATAATGYTFKSLNIAGTNYTTNTHTFTFGRSSVAIDAVFELAKVDPNRVVLTFPSEEACEGKGFRLSKYDAVSATLKSEVKLLVYALASDTANVVVKAGSETIKPNANHEYVIKADADKSISVTLAKPTPIEVTVETETRNAKGYLLGTVEVEGLVKQSSLKATGNTMVGTCYYNDEITLVAYPESGVTLAGWSDDRSNKSKLRTLTIGATKEIKPIFTGVPTGIESIEASEVYGSKGCIVLRGVGEVNVTIVGMDGRIRKQTVAGDTRIETAAGIYGVVLEQGGEVRRVKVIVR